LTTGDFVDGPLQNPDDLLLPTSRTSYKHAPLIGAPSTPCLSRAITLQGMFSALNNPNDPEFIVRLVGQFAVAKSLAWPILPSCFLRQIV
jgi:hypothetical protein